MRKSGASLHYTPYMSKKSKLNIAELQGFIAMVKDATINITELTQDAHHRIVHHPYLPSTPIQHLITGISGFVYRSVKQSTHWIGNGIHHTLGFFHPHTELGLSFQSKETALAVLNGVIGDYLENSKNSLARPMSFRLRGETLELNKQSLHQTYPKANGKILLLIHGLCMNDIQWNQNGHDHGELLAGELGLTPIYLNYNTGKHISQNGQQLSSMLDQLLSAWPVPIEELIIIGHSMGGLITRSAFHYANGNGHSWLSYVKRVVFLGSPHHGAPMEQIGNFVDKFFESNPFIKPFARIGKIRSSGITDLRYNNLLDEDWKGQDRFNHPPDSTIPVPLPKNLTAFAIAATMAKETATIKYGVLGDGLVLVESALGQHANSQKILKFESSKTWIAYETNHIQLLSSKTVYDKMKFWLNE